MSSLLDALSPQLVPITLPHPELQPWAFPAKPSSRTLCRTIVLGLVLRLRSMVDSILAAGVVLVEPVDLLVQSLELLLEEMLWELSRLLMDFEFEWVVTARS